MLGLFPDKFMIFPPVAVGIPEAFWIIGGAELPEPPPYPPPAVIVPKEVPPPFPPLPFTPPAPPAPIITVYAESKLAIRDLA